MRHQPNGENPDVARALNQEAGGALAIGARCLLTMDQAAPWAPWEMRRSQLDAEPVRGVLQRLRETGALDLGTIKPPAQTTLFE